MSISRRLLLKTSAAGGALAAFAGGFSDTGRKLVKGAWAGDTPDHAISGNAPAPEFRVDPATGDLTPTPGQIVANVACLGCTTLCGVRVRVDVEKNKVLRVAGNPYSPLSTDPFLPYGTPIRESFTSLSRLDEKGLKGRSTACGRGNAALEMLTSPFRVATPMKRVGPRGSGQWEPIAFDRLIEEIAEGGDLFGEGPVPGLRSLRDLKTPIDPAAPELGPKVNQVALLSSVNDGREPFVRRFFNQALGTINFVGHGSYCGGAYRSGSGAVFGDAKKMPHAKPDLQNAEFVLFIGTAPSNAGNPFKRQAMLLAKGRTDGVLNYVVVDPVLTNADNRAAAERSNWIPIRPGTDGALVMGMMRWMFENGRIDTNYLSQPNGTAAEAAGEAGWCNATHLVIQQAGHPRDGRMLRASDLGWVTLDEKERYGAKDAFVVLDPSGTPVAHDVLMGPAALFHGGTVATPAGDVAVKTSLTLLREQAMRLDLAGYADACGIPADVIAGLAREFTSHGKKAAANAHGGMMAGNGFYNAFGVVTLNTLIGNLNWKGGTIFGGGRFPDEQDGPRYKLASFPGQVKPSGTAISRPVPYEKSSEFKARKEAGKPYPAKAPWYPNAPQLTTEYLTSGVVDGYPYPLKALFLWNSNPVYGIPGVRAQVEATLRDPKALPLVVAIDPFINESTAFADYIIPDTVLYETWGWASPWAGVPTKTSTARWPVVTPRTEPLPEGRHVQMETFLIALAKRLGLPGFGPDAIADMDGRTHPLERPEDWYLRGGANIAWLGKQPVPDATDEDIALSGVARVLPALQAVLKEEEWRKVAFILARGGRYQNQSEGFEGDKATHRFKDGLLVYNEAVGAAKSSVTGKRWTGTAAWTPPAFADGTPMRQVHRAEDWPFQLISSKSVLVSAYTIAASRLRHLHPENPVGINAEDARRLGIATGDRIRVATPGGSELATAIVRHGVMRGVLAVEHGFGHKEFGARPHVIGGHSQPVVPEIGAGVNINDLGLHDPTRPGASVWVDPIAGTAVRQGLPAKLERVAAAA
ncbi:tetrathionate reductase subunit A (plasmid) [Azospirillum sp. TSH58]|uniref:molybdopterin dinucleotide binding domain-containing protein n=1 Tax=Azospirillum sp. TSH58 TaxID=664962 RepID=UPI000D5FF864|nr:molybdopterin dinucleotide binding domain-containing protein [Azospirillum sp. TSH58]AWJ82295.1 tetrathionate reductase subunit A [Azospirillum sp. TSH58]PWC72975.1 tetrathionate reductase subunit A [Azospirillum sp. TSH58]